MQRKATQARPSPQLRRSSPSKTATFEITSESIAADLAVFRKQGGRIEVLGTTPLRVNVTAFRSKGNTQRKAAAAKAGSAKA